VVDVGQDVEHRLQVEITTLLIPGHNDSPTEIRELSAWVAKELGPDVPLHFSAFHPDWKMDDIPPTPAASLSQARRIALDAGLHYVFTGNVHDSEGGTTFCPQCKAALIVRDWYDIRRYDLSPEGHCPHCQAAIAGRFGKVLGRDGRAFGPNRIPVRLS
jgi:pyruvate formate lyase activating enzyme